MSEVTVASPSTNTPPLEVYLEVSFSQPGFIRGTEGTLLLGAQEQILEAIGSTHQINVAIPHQISGRVVVRQTGEIDVDIHYPKIVQSKQDAITKVQVLFERLVRDFRSRDVATTGIEQYGGENRDFYPSPLVSTFTFKNGEYVDEKGQRWLINCTYRDNMLYWPEWFITCTPILSLDPIEPVIQDILPHIPVGIDPARLCDTLLKRLLER